MSRVLLQYKERALSHQSEVERYTRTIQGLRELVALLNALTTDLEPIENLRNDVLKELNSALSEVDEVVKSLTRFGLRSSS